MPGHVLERAAPQRGPSHDALWWSCAEGRLEAGALGDWYSHPDQGGDGGSGMEGRGLGAEPVSSCSGAGTAQPNPFLWHGLDEVLKSHVAAQPILWDYRGPGASRGP